ncbi:hypothetical protein TrRE_jg12616 [Triparma retinervis]|uniref:Uncharacterized protein n=1 Tax=Triparma retinervis TaxID=2557542 RepID=A0A9W7DLT6_9STRA|nr:hypothetical protein TrRE_jg12616 [Triparma retinervis]
MINNIPLKTSTVNAIINLPQTCLLTSGSGASILLIFGPTSTSQNGSIIQWDHQAEELTVDDLEGHNDHRGFCRDCMVGAVGGAVDFSSLKSGGGVERAMGTLCTPEYFEGRGVGTGAYRLGCVESKEYTDEELREEEEIIGGGEIRREGGRDGGETNEDRYHGFKVQSWPLLVANKEGSKPDSSLKEYLRGFTAPVRSEIMMAGALSTFCFVDMAKSAERAAGDFGWFYAQAVARSDYYYLKCLSASLRVLAAAFASEVDEDAIAAMAVPDDPAGRAGDAVLLPLDEAPEDTLRALGFHKLAELRKPNEDLLMLAARVIDDERLEYCRGEAESLLLQFDR